MNTESHSFSSQKNTSPMQVNLDEFNINEDSFKPMTKGLGFHHEQKRKSFTPAPKEAKSFNSTKPNRPSALLSPLSNQSKVATASQLPSGLEAFYGTSTNTNSQMKEEAIKLDDQKNKMEITLNYPLASNTSQLLAWLIDLSLVASFVAITGIFLVLASGIQFSILMKLISPQDLAIFTASIFSIYYLLYFTILDLSVSPGKTILGIRLLRVDETNVSVKNTFTRALVSLLSGIALFLPLLLDFQGRLSDTKVVK